MSRFYWFIASALMAIAVHIFYVLFVPAMALDNQIRRVAGDAAVNSFEVLTRDAQALLFPGYPAESIFGICRFDVSGNDLMLGADMPDAPWTLAIYTSNGKTLYVLNDQQSGTNTFNVRLSRAPGLMEMFNEAGSADIEAAGWRVETASPRGLAVFWVHGVSEIMRPRLEAALAKTSCKTTKT